MDRSIEEFVSQLKNVINSFKQDTLNVKKYPGNTFYKDKLRKTILDLKKTIVTIRGVLDNIPDGKLKTKLGEICKSCDEFIELAKYPGSSVFEKIDLTWPELEVEINQIKLRTTSFSVPIAIPKCEAKLDLKEAINTFNNGCYVSSSVMCRRAFEGALVQEFKRRTGQEPVKDIKCKNCKATIKQGAYKGIADLHEWAVTEGLVSDKFKSLGFLITDIGAGAAHPPLKEFPRDEEVARLAITATITLLKQIFTSNK